VGIGLPGPLTPTNSPGRREPPIIFSAGLCANKMQASYLGHLVLKSGEKLISVLENVARRGFCRRKLGKEGVKC
jgi:hypothetical protein